MPFFENRFSMKKTPPRKSQSMSSLHQNMDPVTNQKEFGLNYDPAKLRLGNNENVFKDGKWIPIDENCKDAVERELGHLIKENQSLAEENNILKIKVKVLLDMLAETTAESQMQENEILQLQEQLQLLQGAGSDKRKVIQKKPVQYNN